ncbi:MAG: MCP four helix bundle domain-containing protein, partial [Nitrospinota bacterium]
MRKDFSIRAKIISLTSVTIIVIGVLTFFSLRALSLVKEKNDAIKDNYLTSITNLTLAMDNMYPLIINGKNHIMTVNDEEMKTAETEMDQKKKGVSQYLAAFKNTLDPGEETELFESLLAAYQDYLSVHNRVITLSKANRDKEAAALSANEGVKTFREVEMLLHKLLINNVEGAEEAGKEADEVATSTSQVMIIVAILAGLGAFAISILIISSIISPINKMVAVMKDMAKGEGDLTRQL